MATTAKDCEKVAAKCGCKLDIDKSGRCVEISLFSPQGKVFAGTGGHIECGLHGNGFAPGFKPNWSETLADVERVIAEGFEDCDDPECEMCNPPDDA